MPKMRLHWKERMSAAENAHAALPALLKAYFAEGRKVITAAPDSAELHRFRLHTKRVRYTLEMFRNCYGVGLERYLAALRQLQDHLGAMSDCATSRTLIRAAAPRGSPERGRAERLLAANLKRKLSDLRRTWRGTFDAPGEERRWCNYLARARKVRRIPE
jgi:CHAD domain-containing protein